MQKHKRFMPKKANIIKNKEGELDFFFDECVCPVCGSDIYGNYCKCCGQYVQLDDDIVEMDEEEQEKLDTASVCKIKIWEDYDEEGYPLPVIEELSCPHCGDIVSSTDNYCSGCGKKILIPEEFKEEIW